MNKLLLATTGLVGAAMVASAAAADSHTTPKVTVGGFIDFQAGFLSDDLDADQRGHGFRNDTEISFQIDAKTASGLEYGAVIDLEADVSGDVDSANNSEDEGVNAARTYIYLQDTWGRFELGSNEGASNTMAVDADTIAAGTGGINGDWAFFAGQPTNAAGFITRAALPTEHGLTTVMEDQTFDNLTKVTYYSPSFSGFQVGVSYTPDDSDRGQIITLTDTTGRSGEILELGATFDHSWDEISLNLGATYQSGDAEVNTNEDLDAFNVGGVVGFAGFSFAASYGDWDDSNATTASDTDADYYTLGVAYDGGVFGLSATYLDSSVEFGTSENTFENLVFGADYALAPGLTPYAELSLFEFDGQGVGAANDNEGTVFLIGTQLAF